MKNLIRVMVAGNSAETFEMMNVLNRLPYVNMVGSFSSGVQAINAYTKLEPQIIFVDAVLFGMSGFETARFIKEQNADVKVVICSQKFNREFLLAVLSLKLDGYLPGYGNRKVIEETIEAVMLNASYAHYGVGSLDMQELLMYQYQSLISNTGSKS